MASGVVLLNLEDRSAQDFDRILVPDSYEKASGAAEAGAYVTIYKWLYNGFAMSASLCDAIYTADYIRLVDRTNGGELRVYPDDTITILGVSPDGGLIPLTVSMDGVYYPPDGSDGFSSVNVLLRPPGPIQTAALNVTRNGSWVAPFGIDGYNPVTVTVPGASLQPLLAESDGDYFPDEGYDGFSVVTVRVGSTPQTLNFKAYHIYSGSTSSPYSIIVQPGHFVGTEFDSTWTPEDFVADGSPITVLATDYGARPYVCQGCVAISYSSGWYITSVAEAKEYGLIPNTWSSFAANTVLEQLDRDVSWSGKYYCATTGDPVVI